MLRCSATRAMTRTLHEPWPKPKRPPSARDPPSQSAAPQKTAESISRKPYDPAPTARSPESAASRSDPGPTGASLPSPRRSDDQQPAPWLASATHGAPAYPLLNNPGILNPSPSPGVGMTGLQRA